MKIGQRNKSIDDLTRTIGARNKPVKIGGRYRPVRNVKRNNLMLQKMTNSDY
jgi:hypothetical protein